MEQTELETDNKVDTNMTTMFKILPRNHGGIPVERLILNKDSFSQTIENTFILSFLINAGRAAMRKDDKGSLLVGKWAV